MRIDYCDWPDCPKETPATHSVSVKREDGKWPRPLYFCSKHFQEYQVEPAKEYVGMNTEPKCPGCGESGSQQSWTDIYSCNNAECRVKEFYGELGA